ncbi:ArsR/SmtB family transcription factor [Paenibacillus lautus]|uniref:ArsR/SmtB family transcription factor n=1 Tax=Paenibacillus lautus TaxID=1401 RepID=UPI00398A6EDB
MFGEVETVGENQEDIGQAVKVYKALGEPTRLKIALLLAKESNLCFTAVGERLESVAGSTLSHHLKQLTDSGLIDSRKNGSFIHYNVNREVAEKFAPFLLA